MSCKIVAGPLLVVQHMDKICIHSISSGELFSQPIVLSYAQDAANMHCDVFAKSCTGGNKQDTLALRFTQSTSAGNTTSSSNRTAVSVIEWLLLDTTQLHHLLHNTASGSVKFSKLGMHSNFCAFVAHSTVPSIDCAIVTTNKVDYNQYYDFLQASAYCNDNTVSASCSDTTPSQRSLYVGIDKTHQLKCFLDNVLLYTTALPVSYTPHTTHMSLTNTTQPLLLLSQSTTLLLIDVLHKGAVLKEFSNVGAYVCSSLFHPLSQELFIIPHKESIRWNMWGVTGGYCYTPTDITTSVATGTSTTTTANATLPLSDWFVYELPLEHTATSAGNGSTSTTRYTCRSLDCTGRWRKGKTLSSKTLYVLPT